MSNAKRLMRHIERIDKGVAFSNKQLKSIVASRSIINSTLSKLVSKGEIVRLTQGVYAKPAKSFYGTEVLPGAQSVAKMIAEENGETIQVHGAMACNLMGLTTQLPMSTIYYTSGSTRKLLIKGVEIKMRHASPRRLQLAGSLEGVALTALWFAGKENVTCETIKIIKSNLSAKAFSRLRECDIPQWMVKAFN